MPTARSSPHASTAAWWNSAPPASRKPPLRPAAPPATGPASMPTTVAPTSSAAPTAASPEPPSPTTQTSARTLPASGGGLSHAAGSPHTGITAAVKAADGKRHGRTAVSAAPVLPVLLVSAAALPGACPPPAAGGQRPPPAHPDPAPRVVGPP